MDTEWLVNIALTIFLLAVLVDWMTFLIIGFLGITFGYLFYKMVAVEEFVLSAESIYTVIYICIFSTLISLIFARRRQIYQEEELEMVSAAGGVIAHDAKSPLATIMSLLYHLTGGMENVKKNVTKFKKPGKDEKKEKTVYKFEMDELDYDMLFEFTPEALLADANKWMKNISIYLDSMKDVKNARDIGIYSIINSIHDAMKEFGEITKGKDYSVIFDEDGSKDFEFKGSKLLTMRVILNVIKNSFIHGGSDVEVKVWVNGNKVHIRDNGCGIDPDFLPHIFKKHKTDGYGTGLGLCVGRWKGRAVQLNAALRRGSILSLLYIFREMYKIPSFQELS